jgi:hypothetical protein
MKKKPIDILAYGKIQNTMSYRQIVVTEGIRRQWFERAV